jgi:hypothetical protein
MAKTYIRKRQHGTTETIAANGQDRIAAIRKVVEQKQYAKIDGCMADLFTASIVLKVYDALNDKNRMKFSSCSWPVMADMALKLVSKER